MNSGSLKSVSPIDGRYFDKTRELSPFFSEMGFMRYKVTVEIEYFIALCGLNISALKNVSAALFPALRNIANDFSEKDALRIKEIELVTNHDVKAVEYFLKEKFSSIDSSLENAKEFIHFGLTSQDINNTAVPMMLRDSMVKVIIPGYENILDILREKANQWKSIPMLARTHGQPASPTLLGKEIFVYVSRLENQLNELKSHPFPGKFGGATGNFNAHYVAFPKENWQLFADNFLQNTLGLQRSFPTTQIDHYDGLARIFDNIARINTLLTDLCVDCWLYISAEYFTQKVQANEVGSSAMPHKVNPIDFENAEGNFQFANAVLQFLSRSLPVSRLQRDLTDSTKIRNTGVGLAHAWLAVQSLKKGLGKIEVNEKKIREDLEQNWAVVAEAIQTILRRENYPNPYEALKALTRGKTKIDETTISEFIDSLEVSSGVKKELHAIRPENYFGRVD